jgi:hypothetical protein
MPFSVYDITTILAHACMHAEPGQAMEDDIKYGIYRRKI